MALLYRIGQLSGMVEPIAGFFGAVAVSVRFIGLQGKKTFNMRRLNEFSFTQWATPLLPYALAFAAGAMIFVVLDEIVPETHTGGNAKLASTCAMLGFIVMMSLDVGLG